MEQTKFYHRNFENSQVMNEDSRKREIITVRMQLKQLQQLKEDAQKTGLDFSEYIRRRLSN